MRKRGGHRVKRIRLMLVVAIVMVTGTSATGTSAQAQQTFDVVCFVPPVGESFCFNPDVGGIADPYTCNPDAAPVGTPSRCTNIATGQTFGCVITDRAFPEGGGSINLHTCGGAEAPPDRQPPDRQPPDRQPPDRQRAAPGLELTQETEQEAESGDVDQSFEITSEGDNSNQCAGVQGVTNTGNSQNQTSVTQVEGEADDFEFDEVDSTIEMNPTSETTCDQQVNQAASATG